MTLYSLLEWYCIRNKFGISLINGKITCYLDRCILTTLKTPFKSGGLILYGYVYYPEMRERRYIRLEDFKYIYNILKEKYDRADDKGDV